MHWVSPLKHKAQSTSKSLAGARLLELAPVAFPSLCWQEARVREKEISAFIHSSPTESMAQGPPRHSGDLTCLRSSVLSLRLPRNAGYRWGTSLQEQTGHSVSAQEPYGVKWKPCGRSDCRRAGLLTSTQKLLKHKPLHNSQQPQGGNNPRVPSIANKQKGENQNQAANGCTLKA